MTPRRRFSDEVMAIVEEGAIKGLSVADIERALTAARIHPASQPARRTIQKIVHDAVTLDRSGPWVLADTDGDDARLILGSLRAVTLLEFAPETAVNSILRLTKAEARWIVRVRRAAPTLPPMYAWFMARLYVAREAREQSTRDLDALLAFLPASEGEEPDAAGYEKAIHEGRIPAAPAFFTIALMNLRDLSIYIPTEQQEEDAE